MPITRRLPFLGERDPFGGPGRGGLRPFPMEQAPTAPDYPSGLAMPRGAPNIDVGLPISGSPLWDEAKQQLMSILQRPQEKMFTGTDLTPDQIAHNRMLETRLLPQVATARISAEAVGARTELAQKEVKSQKLSTRLTNLEKQMQTVHLKKDMAGKAKVHALRDLANQHVATRRQLEKHDPDAAAMHSEYDPETGQPSWFEKEPPGFFRRALGWAWDKYFGLHEYMMDTEEADAVPESPLQALEMMDRALRQKETPEKAQQMVDQVKAAAPMSEGANPQQVALGRVQALNDMVKGEKAPPAAPAVAAQLKARPRLKPRQSLLEKFQQRLPSNEEYIRGGGMPGFLLRGFRGPPEEEPELFPPR